MTFRRSIVWVLLGALAAGAGQAATWNVDNTVACNDSTCAPCCTIQGAVGKSSGGDIISVADGSYPENIDFRGMSSIGDITLQAASTPANVLVSPPTGHTVRHGDGHTNTVTIEGITFDSTEADKSCVYLDHAGDAVLRDVTANGCAYTAFLLDNTGSVTMEQCTANQSARTGIQVDGASEATLTGCTASSNAESGIKIINTAGSVTITNPTTNGNTDHGIDLDLDGPLTIQGATVTGSGGRGIWAYSRSTIEISSSVVSGGQEDGVRLETGGGSDLIDGVTLDGLQSDGNGLGSPGNGLYLTGVSGPVVVTDCIFDGNSSNGFEIVDSVLTDLEITGGHANSNTELGFEVRAAGNATVVGVEADSNSDGLFFAMTGTVTMADCGADGNQLGDGIRVEWLDPDTLDQVSITNCTANDNGLAGGGNGIYVKDVVGAVTIDGTTTNGNSRTNIRVDSTAGEVLISGCMASSGLEEGIKIDADVGPVTVESCTVDNNPLEGLLIRREDVDIETVTVTRNVFTNNGDSGVFLDDLAASGTYDVTCNDIVGNGHGLYLSAATTVDARYVWWGDASGPSGQGPGSGDTVFAELGGTILFAPWFTEPCAACVGVVNLTLANDSCIDTEAYEACYSITVGPNYGVYGPGGDLMLTAPLVHFEDGFFVGIDGSLTAGNP